MGHALLNSTPACYRIKRRQTERARSLNMGSFLCGARTPYRTLGEEHVYHRPLSMANAPLSLWLPS